MKISNRELVVISQNKSPQLIRNPKNQLQKNQECDLLIIRPDCVSELPMKLLKI